MRADLGVGALDWHVGYDCSFKRRFTLAQVAPVVHAPGGPAGVQERLRSADPGGGGQEEASTPDASEGGAALRRTSPTEAGLVETVIPGIEATRRTEAALRFRRTCRDCPANGDRGREGFGCYGTLSMPIAEASERALIEVIVRIMEGGDDVDAGATAPIRHIWDNGVSGRRVGALRQREGWFEGAGPVVARVGPFLEKRDFSSDQLFEVFLGAGKFPLEYTVLFRAFLSEFPRLAMAMDTQVAADAAPLSRFFGDLLRAHDLGVDVHLTQLIPGPAAEDVDDGSDADETAQAMELGLMEGT